MKTSRAPRLSAGVVVVRRAATGWLFLMLRAYRNWDFPKGLVEGGEDSLAAARREVQEETLIEDLHFDWGQVYCETAPYDRNKVARYYLARTATEAVTLPVRPELGRPEHHESRWVDYDEALVLASPRVDAIIKWAAAALAAATQEIP
jgi:8-oxo-dGTP pyrophosphatase MutT (NUDIX family)